MTTARRHIETPEDWTSFLAFMGDYPRPCTISVTPGGARSLDQNALLHKWLGEVGRQRGETLMDVKAEANLVYGLPILTRDDPQYSAFFKAIALTYEQKLKAFKLGFVACTSIMTKAQLSEYMDAFSRDMRMEGYTLTDPDQ